MNDEARKTRRKLTGGMLLFTASFFFYALASPGNLPGDTELRWSVSRQIVRGRGFALEESVRTNNYAVGLDGRRYVASGLGQSLCLLPFAGFGLALEKVAPISPDLSDLTAQFLASLILFPAIGALGVYVFYHLILCLGYSRATALLTGAVFAFATMHAHYSVNTQEQSQMSLLLILSLLLMVKYHQGGRGVHVWLFCAVLGGCILFRPASTITVLPIYAVAVGAELFVGDGASLLKRLRKWLMPSVCGIGGIVAFLGWFNYMRFGSVFETGYALSTGTAMGGHALFESSALPTLAAMLFSPGKSIFLYNPVLVVAVVCILRFYRAHKPAAIAIGGAVVCNFALYSFATTWAGDYAWGIRYQVPVLAFLLLPIVVVLSGPIKSLTRTVVLSLAAVSCVIQLASVVYNFNLEFVQNPNHHLIPDGWVWDWPQSHLRKRFENIGRHAVGSRDFSSVPVTVENPMPMQRNRSEQEVRAAYCVNFFPFKAKNMLPSPKYFYPLLCVWLCLLAVFCVATARLVRALASPKTGNAD